MIDKISYLNTLAEQKIREKEDYALVLNSLEIDVLSYPLSLQHIYDMNFGDTPEKLEKLLNILKNDDFSNGFSYEKFDLWLEYSYWKLWQHFRNIGLGHLSEFSIRGKRIYCEIHTRFSQQKRLYPNETIEEKFIRISNYNKELEENNIKKKETIIGEKVIYDNNSVSYIEKCLNNCVAFSPNSLKYNLIEGCIDTISFYISDIFDCVLYSNNIQKDEINKKDLLSDNELEEIKHICKEWASSYYMKLEYENNDSKVSKELVKTCISTFFTFYFSLCSKVGVSNNFTKQYSEFLPINRNISLQIQNVKEKLCSNCKIAPLLETYYSIQTKLEEYLKKNYCLSLEGRMVYNKYVGTIRWASYEYSVLEYLEENDEPEIDVCNINNTFYFPNTMTYNNSHLEYVSHNIKALEKIILEDLCGEIKEVSLKYDKDKIIISQISFEIFDMEKILKLFL